MGGGVSTEKELEAVLACTMMIGEAMIKGLDTRYIRFPGEFVVVEELN